MKNITPGKYRTRDGGEAYVVAIIPTTYNPVVGYRIVSQDDYNYPRAMAWDTDGRLYTTLDDADDLMERI